MKGFDQDLDLICFHFPPPGEIFRTISQSSKLHDTTPP